MDTGTVQEIIYSQEEFLDLVLLGALEGRFQLAVFKHPNEQRVHILIDTTDRIKRVPLQLEGLPPGFIVHPFADQQDKKAFFLEASNLLSFDLDGPGVCPGEAFPHLNASVKGAEIKSRIRQELARVNFQSSQKPTDPGSKEDFMALVDKGIKEILDGRLTKIVPVRRKKVAVGQDFDVARVFLSLCGAYPNAFVNFLHIPSVGSWIGASPEILIKTKGDVFSTMSLAGSQKAVGNNPLKNVAWTQKEIEEQALVSRYIVNCFKKIRLREYEEVGPKTDVAGNILHLRTDFRVDMKATGFPELGSIMLDLLHPTSAVAGSPREPALEFLQKNEGFDRALFAGFLGPVNFGEETAMFVNIRCAQLLGGHAMLYAGAGVTEDSSPEKEWEETELKCDIIGKFIQGNQQ